MVVTDRCDYEDAVARTPSWPGETLRPDTLMQTAQSLIQKQLADRAGHTFILFWEDGSCQHLYQMRCGRGFRD